MSTFYSNEETASVVLNLDHVEGALLGDGDGATADVDCNDDNPHIYPGARVNPDEPSILAICLTTGLVDVDCDGHADMVCDIDRNIDEDADGVTRDRDCDDSNPDIGAAPDGEQCPPEPVDCDDPNIICNG